MIPGPIGTVILPPVVPSVDRLALLLLPALLPPVQLILPVVVEAPLVSSAPQVSAAPSTDIAEPALLTAEPDLLLLLLLLEPHPLAVSIPVDVAVVPLDSFALLVNAVRNMDIAELALLTVDLHLLHLLHLHLHLQPLAQPLQAMSRPMVRVVDLLDLSVLPANVARNTDIAELELPTVAPDLARLAQQVQLVARPARPARSLPMVRVVAQPVSSVLPGSVALGMDTVEPEPLIVVRNTPFLAISISVYILVSFNSWYFYFLKSAGCLIYWK